MAKSYKMSVPVSLDQKHINFINRTGVGKNFSDKARSILDRSMTMFDVLVTYDGISVTEVNPEACNIFELTADGEKLWAAELPFDIPKQAGWRKIPDLARKNNFLCQVIEDLETGYVGVFVAPQRGQRDCKICQEKVAEVMRHGT